MWILESNGDFLQGKRMWLKPGKKYLFGRVKHDGVRFAIDHKTVSRKHFVITVEDVKDEDVGQVHTKSKVTVTDENSKAGTNIDGHLLKGQSQELTHDTTSIRPGSCPYELLISWVPCVLTFNLLKKEIKAGALKPKQDRVRELAIKATSDFIPGKTTHLIVQKRNTPKGLQALIDGVHLVTESYVDALIYAATPTDLGEEENLCPLEIDFDDAWPDPAQYLPPPGKEPTSRPAEAYQPDSDRHNVFENFTFVFVSQSQYDTLLAPITMGHGKVLLLKVVSGQTTAEDAVAFMKKTAGVKHFGNANKSKEKGGVIMVRNTEPDEETTDLVRQVASKLNQRAIEQGDFLDAILANDATLLRVPAPLETHHAESFPQQSMPTAHSQPATLPEDQPLEGRALSAPATETVNGKVGKPLQQQENIERPAKRPRFITPKKMVFKDFDDDFDPNSIAAYDEDNQASARQVTSGHEQVESDDVSIKEEGQSTRKRRRSLSPQDDEDDEMDDFLPGAAAMRKETQAKEARARRNGLLMGSATKSQGVHATRTKREEKQIDVREAVRARRKAEDEAARKEQDQVRVMQAEDEGSGPADYVKIQSFEIPVRERSETSTNGVHGDRWDPKWNGRKNFKKFRRARDSINGDATDKRANHSKVIVPVVEVRRNVYGMGRSDQSWRRSAAERGQEIRDEDRRKGGSHGQSQTSSSGNNRVAWTTQEHSEDEEQDEHNHVDAEHASPELDRLQREAAEVLHHAIDLESPRRTRAGDPLTQTKAPPKKRPAAGIPAGPHRTTKKQKTLPVTVIHGSDSDGDDSDDMKFQFGRATKGKGKTKATS